VMASSRVLCGFSISSTLMSLYQLYPSNNSFEGVSLNFEAFLVPDKN
jgi:hypothetical protein